MTYGQSPMESGSVRGAMHLSQQHPMHQTTQGGRPAQPASTVGVQQQRSLSSSEEERSTEYASDEPDESEKGKRLKIPRRILKFSVLSSDLLFRRIADRGSHVPRGGNYSEFPVNVYFPFSFFSFFFRFTDLLLVASTLRPAR